METTITEKDLEEAHNAIAQLADREGVSEAVICDSMMEAIRAGQANQDPAVQAKWRSIAPDGESITPEMLIAWVKKQLE